MITEVKEQYTEPMIVIEKCDDIIVTSGLERNEKGSGDEVDWICF